MDGSGTAKNSIHVGGCINNRSPLIMDGANCDCYKIQFIASAFGKAYEIRMCREWVRYEAERIVSYRGTHDPLRTSEVVKRSIMSALNVSDDWLIWHRMKNKRVGKKQAEVAGEFGALPTHFPEIVYSNRYGHLLQLIPCHIAASIPPYSWNDINHPHKLWTGWAKGYSNVISTNIHTHRQFIKALERACTRSEACKLTGLDDRKLMLAMIETLKLKTSEDETNEQQVGPALFV